MTPHRPIPADVADEVARVLAPVVAERREQARAEAPRKAAS